MSTTIGFESDYATLLSGVGLSDASARGKLALTGKGAKEFLHGQLTQDIIGLQAGQGCYAAFLTPKGKMLGDLRVLDTGDGLLLDTERVALQDLFNMIRRYAVGYDVELHKRTVERGLLSLSGPAADEIIMRVFSGDELTSAEHDHAPGQIAAASVRLIRTPTGADVLMSSEDTATVRSALLEAGAQEVAEAALECRRIETGRPRYGIDLDDSVIPQEAGLNDRAVSFTKGCYVGQETVARLFYKGKPNRELRGLRSAEQIPPGTELMLGERGVGSVTSSTTSPRLGALALALVRREAPIGAVLRAGDDHEAVVSPLPFD